MLVSLYPNHWGKWDTATHDGIVPLPWKQIRFYLWAFSSLSWRDKGLIMRRLDFILFMNFKLLLVNSFHANALFLYSLKMSENLWFYVVFRGYRNGKSAWKELTKKVSYFAPGYPTRILNVLLVLNISGLHRVLNMPEDVWLCLMPEYSLICLYIEAAVCRCFSK